jgi:hypothetical protein
MWEAVGTLDLEVLRQPGSAAARRISAAFTPPITRYLTTPRIPRLGSFERCALGVFHGKRLYKLDLKIVAREVVQVAQIEFDAFRVEGSGYSTPQSGQYGARKVYIERRQWLVLGLNFPLRTEYFARVSVFYPISSNRNELVTLRQLRSRLSDNISGNDIVSRRNG